jgi:hypothetical protein
VLHEQLAHLEHVEDPVRDRLSQLDSVRQNPLGDPRTQSPLGDDVDVPLQEILEVHEQPAKVHQAATRLQIDEEIHIARFRGITSGNRTEDPHVRGASSARDLDDLVASFAQLGQ